MNYLKILYQASDYDHLFRFLKHAFGTNVGEVQVDTNVEDALVTIRWNDLLDPNALAAELTQELPSVLIECPSNTGIDVYSRYFNKNQLW